jgi:hypothetical protein
MSRSFKKWSIFVCSKARDVLNRRRERHAVKQALKVDPLSDIPNRDSKELGKDEWGTWFGVQVWDILDEHDREQYEKGRRK